MTARPFVHEPPCHECGRPSARSELRRDDDRGWVFVYRGICAGTGTGGLVVSEEQAAALTLAFDQPFDIELMDAADVRYDRAGYCERCGVPYCFTHWDPSTTGGGCCPVGHRQILDPYY